MLQVFSFHHTWNKNGWQHHNRDISFDSISNRVQLNETCMALQSGQWALVHLNLLDKQLTEPGMINARDIMNGTAPAPSEKR